MEKLSNSSISKSERLHAPNSIRNARSRKILPIISAIALGLPGCKNLKTEKVEEVRPETPRITQTVNIDESEVLRDILWLMTELVRVAPIHKTDYTPEPGKEERDSIIEYFRPALEETVAVIRKWVEKKNSQYPTAPKLAVENLPLDPKKAQVIRVWAGKDHQQFSKEISPDPCADGHFAVMPHVDRMYASTRNIGTKEEKSWSESGWPAAPNLAALSVDEEGQLNLLGRGTDDDLSGVVQGLVTLDQFRRHPLFQKKAVCLELVLDTQEEVDTELPRFLEQAKRKPNYALVPDGCADRTVAEKAIFRQKITVQPGLQEQPKEQRALKLLPGSIGTRVNQIPDFAALELQFQKNPEHTFDKVVQAIHEIVKGLEGVAMIEHLGEKPVKRDEILVMVSPDPKTKKIAISLVGPSGHGSSPCYKETPTPNPLVYASTLVRALIRNGLITKDHAVVTMQFLSEHFSDCHGLFGGNWDKTPESLLFGKKSTSYNPTTFVWNESEATLRFDVRTGIHIDIKTPDGHNPTRYLQQFINSLSIFAHVKANIESITKPDSSVTKVYTSGESADRMTESDRAWDRAIREVTGKEPDLAEVPGRTDGYDVRNSSPGIQVIVSGPGRTECAKEMYVKALHGTGENIRLEEVIEATRIDLRWIEILLSKKK